MTDKTLAITSPVLGMSDLTSPDPQHSDYYRSVFDDERERAFVMCETDDGWMVEVTIRTAGAVRSISQIFVLPDRWQGFLSDLYEHAEDRIVFGDDLDGDDGLDDWERREMARCEVENGRSTDA